MTAVHTISQDRLKALLHYDPLTGVFTRLVRTSNRIKVGDVAGGMNSGGYIQIRIDGILQQAHRLAWLYMTGEWPSDEIDHENTIPSDNRWKNLRQATHQQNSHNQRRAHSHNGNRLLGVQRNGARFSANIRVSGVRQYLGTFSTPELAHQAYVNAKRKLHETCTI